MESGVKSRMLDPKASYLFFGSAVMTGAPVYAPWFLPFLSPYFFWFGLIGIVSVVLLSIRDLTFGKHRGAALVFFKPADKYSLTWDPPQDIQIITQPGNQDSARITRLPIFRIKNLGASVLRDVKIEWEVPKELLSAAVRESERMKRFDVLITDQNIEITKTSPHGVNKWFSNFAYKDETKIEYISPQIDNDSYLDAPIPPMIFSVLEVFAVSQLPLSPPFSSVVADFSVKISYKEDGKDNKINQTIRMIARSTRPSSNGRIMIPMGGIMRDPPEIMAEIDFDVPR